MSRRQSKLDSLSKEGRQELIRKLYNAQRKRCYVCNKDINLSVHKVDIDHIKALDKDGPDDESNWGLTHDRCNRSKGTRDLQLQRILYEFRSHVEKYTKNSGTLTLNEALQELTPERQEVGYKFQDNQIKISWTNERVPETETYSLLEEPGRPPAKSFLARIPFVCLFHDHEINPRSIIDLEPMIEEFYKGYIQLQPSLATLTTDGSEGKSKILVFDGQHKAAAQLYARRKRLFVRVFVDYNKNRLKETNFRAHTKLAQVHFPQLINDRVGSDLFTEEFDKFRLSSNPKKDSEKTFFQKYLDKSLKSEYSGYFKNNLRYEVLTGKAGAEDNKLLSFTETVTSRAKKFPLSYDTLQKSFLQQMLFLRSSREPMDVTEKFRTLERENLIRIMNLFVDEILAKNRFDLNLGIFRLEERLANNPETIPDNHLRAYRICRQSAMTIWALEFKRAIAVLLNTKQKYTDSSWPQDRPLWVETSPQDWDQIRKMLCAIRDHKVWGERTNPDIVNALKSTRQKDWKEILLRGRLPGRQEECLPPLDQNFIFNSVQFGA